MGWVSFTIPQDASGMTYLDITTNDSGIIDTEVGLYDSAGDLVANTDDEGVSLWSTLSFGAGSGMTLGDSFNLGGDGIADGEDGPLSAGTYFIATGEFNVTYGTTSFDATSTGPDDGGSVTVSVFTNIPSPSAAGLLGVAGIGAMRRRRR